MNNIFISFIFSATIFPPASLFACLSVSLCLSVQYTVKIEKFCVSLMKINPNECSSKFKCLAGIYKKCKTPYESIRKENFIGSNRLMLVNY